MYWEEEYVVVENSVEDGYVSAYDNYIVKVRIYMTER